MDHVLAISGIVRVVYLLASLAGLGFVEWWLDRRQTGVTGKNAYDLIDDTPLSLAVFRGLRFIGVCILLGLALG